MVNSWVSNATRGKITEIVDEETLQDLVLLLINALYFKGGWEAPFQKQVGRCCHAQHEALHEVPGAAN